MKIINTTQFPNTDHPYYQISWSLAQEGLIVKEVSGRFQIKDGHQEGKDGCIVYYENASKTLLGPLNRLVAPHTMRTCKEIIRLSNKKAQIRQNRN